MVGAATTTWATVGAARSVATTGAWRSAWTRSGSSTTSRSGWGSGTTSGKKISKRSAKFFMPRTNTTMTTGGAARTHFSCYIGHVWAQFHCSGMSWDQSQVAHAARGRSNHYSIATQARSSKLRNCSPRTPISQIQLTMAPALGHHSVRSSITDFSIDVCAITWMLLLKSLDLKSAQVFDPIPRVISTALKKICQKALRC